MILQYIRDLANGVPFSFPFFIFKLLSVIAVIFISLPFHEFAHAFVASKFGDNTAKSMGRLTLNPMAHFDTIGTLMFMFIGIGYAKPVPINPNNFDRNRYRLANVSVSLAGPLANFLLAFLAIVILRIFSFFTISSMVFVYLVIFIHSFAFSNIYLAVFNLLPIPPLDGSKIIMAFMPTNWQVAIYRNEQIMRTIFFILIFMGAFSGILSSVSEVIFGLFTKILMF